MVGTRADRRRRASTLPLRGRVGAELRGGVTREHTGHLVTPTRRFAATSPLKGEGERAVRASSPVPFVAWASGDSCVEGESELIVSR